MRDYDLRMSLSRNLLAAAADIKLHHSVFALPFALLGACLAAMQSGGLGAQRVALDAINQGQIVVSAQSVGVDWSQVPWVLLVACMVTARTAAMLLNRILDAAIDGRNARTARRAIPSGALSRSAAIAIAGAASILFIASCASFGVWRQNWWPLRLSIPVLLWLLAYPLLKRRTWLCHVWLGVSLAISVPAAALAVQPAAVAQPVVWWLAAMVLLWVGGFDVIYALQDVQVDRREGLFSMPATLGEEAALWISAAMHVAAVACLVAAIFAEPALGQWFQVAVAVTALLLIFEHATVRRWGTTRMALTFFTLNGCVSVVLGTAGILGLSGFAG